LLEPLVPGHASRSRWPAWIYYLPCNCAHPPEAR
jgi:hypothetical protein